MSATAWPAAVLVHLWQIRRFERPDSMPMKRVPQAVWAALRHNILPGEYYAYRLWERDRRANIDNYLYSNEAARLFKSLNQPLQIDPIEDKLAFFSMCKAHAIPTPAILAAFAPACKLLDFECGAPPEHDLFVKPRSGLAGHGAERFHWRGAVFESNRGYHIERENLSNYIAARARCEKRTLLVQPALSNHPALYVEANGALATARLVTGRSTDGTVIPIFGFIYFGRPNRITAQHGHVALVDVINGELAATPIDCSDAKHPDYRLDASPDYPHVLPDWGVALQHATNAHLACSNFAFIGWDIAFTINGPTLLEGNANWSADEYQSLSGQPLGNTIFADILADCFRCK
jgi:hypothetical protein